MRMNKGYKGTMYVKSTDEINKLLDAKFKLFADQLYIDTSGGVTFDLYDSEYCNEDIIEIVFKSFSNTYKDAKEKLVYSKKLFYEYFNEKPQTLTIGKIERLQY